VAPVASRQTAPQPGAAGSADVAADLSAVLSPGRRRAVLAAMCLSLVLVVASVASINLALPELSVDLDASGTALTWVADAYTLALAALVLPFGALGDRIGRRTTLLAGTVVFGLAAAFAVAADTSALLISWRAVMGVGAALIMPATLSTITAVFPRDERARAVGLWAGFASAGGIFGLLVSGALLEHYWWGSTFMVAAGLAAVSFVVAVMVAPNTADPSHTHLDPLGSLLSLVGIGSLVLGIIEGADAGWTSRLSLAAFAAAAVGLTGFVLWELRTDAPLLDPRLFRLRGFGTGTATITLQFLAVFGFFFVGLQFLQLLLGYGPLRTSLALLPMAVVLLPLAAFAPTLVARFGTRVVIAAGLLAMISGLLALTALTPGSGYWDFLACLLVFGAGTALTATPATNAVVASLPPAKQGVASAVNDATREIGAALGIALFGSLFDRGYRRAIDPALAGLPPEAANAVRQSPAAALEVAAQLGDVGFRLADQVPAAFLDGLDASLIGGSAVLVAGLAFVVWRAPTDRA
jgi:EmrB/QacA subfamily drug resistance transporter